MTTTPPPPITKHSEPMLKNWPWTDAELAWVAARDAQWQAYATQARADLEAENKRLREALKTVQAAIYMDDAGQLRLTKSFDESVIDAALWKQP